MLEATSCGGVVIFRGKILLLYKNYKNKYEGWVLPKGTVEQGEEFKETALREVLEESGAKATIIKRTPNKYEGWVLPKGTVEQGEDYKDTALREVLEESGAKATIIKYIGKSEYTFNVPEDIVEKEVHWYLMMADSYYSKPQKEEFFSDSGYYKYHEAYHLLKFANEKQILEKAYEEYLELKKSNLWGSKKYY